MLLCPGSDFPQFLFHISVSHCEGVIVPHEVIYKCSGIPILNILESLMEKSPHSPPQNQRDSPGCQGAQEGDLWESFHCLLSPADHHKLG